MWFRTDREPEPETSSKELAFKQQNLKRLSMTRLNRDATAPRATGPELRRTRHHGENIKRWLGEQDNPRILWGATPAQPGKPDWEN